MSQNPWSSEGQFGKGGGGGPGGEEVPVGPARLSALAVTSLVCSLVCCVPGLPSVAVALGAGGLVSIGRSNGRLSGRGLAITGIILGLLLTVLQVGVTIGAAVMWKTVTEPIGEFFGQVDKADAGSVRGYLTTAAGKQVTDADVKAFADAVRDGYGPFKEVPSNLLDAVNAYVGMEMPTEMQNTLRQAGATGSRSADGVLPIPVKFSKGTATALVLLDLPSMQGTGSVKGAVRNVLVALPGGKVISLVPAGPGAGGSGGGGSGGATAPPPP